MKIFLMAFMSMFFFSGCMTFVNGYEPRFMEPLIDTNKSKITEISISINDLSPKTIERKPRGFVGSASTHIFEISSINKNAAKGFMKQYFSDVNENVNADLVINTKIESFEFTLGSITSHIEMDIQYKIEVFLKGELILSKTYKEFFNSDSEFNVMNFSVEEMTGTAMVKNGINSEFFKFYENKFKPDLIEALKKHYIK